MGKVLIAAGGTGGHIYPAIAVADQLKKLNSNLELIFVGTPSGLENKIVPKAGFELEHIPIGRLNKNVSLLERLKTLVYMPWALIKSVLLVLRHRPLFLLGVGGHASGPLLLAASVLGYRTYIWEPNAYPGLANRYLAPFVHEVLVVFDQVRSLVKAKRCRKVGMPIRKEIEAASQQHKEHKDFHVLVFGGSQGARGINNAVAEMLSDTGEWRKDIRVVHQTGPLDYRRIHDGYQKGNVDVEVTEFLYDMDQRYIWADLVISRSGMSTVAELAAVGKPSILIPLPTAADNHQQKNAEALVLGGAAEMLLQKDLTAQRLRAMILKLKDDKLRREAMSRNARKFYEPNAARAIAYHLLEDSRSPS